MQQPQRAPRAQIHLRDRYNVKGAEAGLPPLPLLTQRSVHMRTTHPHPRHNPHEKETVFCQASGSFCQDCALFTCGKGNSAGQRGGTRPLGMWERTSPTASCAHFLHVPSSQILCTLGVNFASSPTCGLWLSPQRGLEEKNRFRNKISIIKEGTAGFTRKHGSDSFLHIYQAPNLRTQRWVLHKSREGRKGRSRGL